MRELLGQILGIALVVVGAWFAALFLLGYSLGDILPWHWTPEQRGIHLAVQMALIGVYFFVTRPRAE